MSCSEQGRVNMVENDQTPTILAWFTIKKDYTTPLKKSNFYEGFMQTNEGTKSSGLIGRLLAYLAILAHRVVVGCEPPYYV